MEEELILIYDKDERYLSALSKFFSVAEKKHQFHFISERKDISKELESGDFSLVLSSEELNLKKELSFLLLSEDERNENALFKYLPGPLLLEGIEKKMQEVSFHAGLSLSKCIAITSPFGRAGKTDFLFGLSLLKSAKERVLFLSFDLFSTLKEELLLEGENKFPVLIYDLQTKDEVEPSTYVFSYEKLHLLLPTSHPEDLFETDEDLFLKMVRMIKKSGQYDLVCLDLGRNYKLLKMLYTELDLLYVATLEERFSTEKMAEFERFIKRIEREQSVPEKIIHVPKREGSKQSKSYRELLFFGELGAVIRKEQM